ncbi:MAG TPA: cytochrome c [Rhodocyclaceae bacterium]
MKTLLAVALGLGALLIFSSHLAAQMGMGRGMGGMMGGAGVSMQRHRLVVMNGVPAPYASARNPLEGTAANIAAGKALFQQNCVACHGTAGRGDGPAAAGLNPRPADIAAAMGARIATDAYLDWTLSEGGAPVHSAMPAFKASLAPQQIWQLILYLRTL